MKVKVVVLMLSLILLSFLVIFLVNLKESAKKINPAKIGQIEKEKILDKNQTGWPPYLWLDLPIEYFSDDDVEWGSVKPGFRGDTTTINDYEQVALGNKAVYQSYPTTEITIKDYSSEVQPLKVKPLVDIKKEIQPGDIFLSGRVEENYKEYGALASNYLPDNSIEETDYFDVDSDGIKEEIIEYNFTNRADAGSSNSDIIKNNNIIFSVKEDNSRIVPADTSNGFYVEWRKQDYVYPRCCEPGFIRTRFVFKEGKFIPLYEQEVKYMIVGNVN